MRERRVYVDMDGVGANFDHGIMERMPEEIPRVVRKNFYYADDYPEHAHIVRAIAAEPDFFADLKLIDGALEGWQRIIDCGYEPIILSAPFSGNRNCIEGKIQFLLKHFVPVFGKQVVEKAIIDKQKYNYDGIALIDDRPIVDRGEGRATWEHIIFNQDYNQHIGKHVLRLMGWDDPKLENTLQKAEEGYLIRAA